MSSTHLYTLTSRAPAALCTGHARTYRSIIEGQRRRSRRSSAASSPPSSWGSRRVHLPRPARAATVASPGRTAARPSRSTTGRGPIPSLSRVEPKPAGVGSTSQDWLSGASSSGRRACPSRGTSGVSSGTAPRPSTRSRLPDARRVAHPPPLAALVYLTLVECGARAVACLSRQRPHGSIMTFSDRPLILTDFKDAELTVRPGRYEHVRVDGHSRGSPNTYNDRSRPQTGDRGRTSHDLAWPSVRTLHVLPKRPSGRSPPGRPTGHHDPR